MINSFKVGSLLAFYWWPASALPLAISRRRTCHAAGQWFRGYDVYTRPIHMAAYEARPDLMRLLLSKRANPESPDRKGRTPVAVPARPLVLRWRCPARPPPPVHPPAAADPAGQALLDDARLQILQRQACSNCC